MLTKKEIKNLHLRFDPSQDSVLGVFGDFIHVQVSEAVLQIPRAQYVKSWILWLNGKKEYCERYNHYCGVMGNTIPLEFTQTQDIIINEWSQSDEDYKKVSYPSFIVTRFDDVYDFEHG